MTSEYLVQLNVLTPYVYVSMADHGVKLTLRHLTAARGRRNIRHDLAIEVLDQVRAHDDIEIAYPTYSVDFPSNASLSSPLDEASTGGDSPGAGPP